MDHTARTFASTFIAGGPSGREYQACGTVRGDDVRIARLPPRNALLAKELAWLQARDQVAASLSVLAHDIGMAREQQKQRVGRLALLDDGEARREPSDLA